MRHDETRSVKLGQTDGLGQADGYSGSIRFGVSAGQRVSGPWPSGIEP